MKFCDLGDQNCETGFSHKFDYTLSGLPCLCLHLSSAVKYSFY